MFIACCEILYCLLYNTTTTYKTLYIVVGVIPIDKIVQYNHLGCCIITRRYYGTMHNDIEPTIAATKCGSIHLTCD